MQKDKIKVEAEEVPHPLDVNYKLLKANLDHVKKGDKDYQIIEKYLKATEPSYQKLEIMDIWKVDREGEVCILNVMISPKNAATSFPP